MADEFATIVAALCEVGLDTLDNLTSEQFANGGDRPARKALATILGLVGALDDETRREYGLYELTEMAR